MVVAIAYGFLHTRATRWIPLSLVVICLFSAFGPWSASSVSLRSQKALLLAEFEQLGVVSDGQFVAKPQAITAATITGLRSRLQYLLGYHSPHIFDQMMVAFPDWAKTAPEHSRYGYNQRVDLLMHQLGLGSPSTVSGNYTLATHEPFIVRTNGVVSLHSINYRWENTSNQLLPNSGLTLTFSETTETILNLGTESVTVRWQPFLTALANIENKDSLPHEKLTQRTQIGPYDIELTATNAYLYDQQLNSLDLLVVVYPQDK